ncbi:MAG: FecR domain-containing protein [Cyanobacteriota bacterium]
MHNFKKFIIIQFILTALFLSFYTQVFALEGKVTALPGLDKGGKVAIKSKEDSKTVDATLNAIIYENGTIYTGGGAESKAELFVIDKNQKAIVRIGSNSYLKLNLNSDKIKLSLEEGKILVKTQNCLNLNVSVGNYVATAEGTSFTVEVIEPKSAQEEDIEDEIEEDELIDDSIESNQTEEIIDEDVADELENNNEDNNEIQADIEVFEGEINLKDSNNPEEMPMKIKAGQRLKLRFQMKKETRNLTRNTFRSKRKMKFNNWKEKHQAIKEFKKTEEYKELKLWQKRKAINHLKKCYIKKLWNDLKLINYQYFEARKDIKDKFFNANNVSFNKDNNPEK